MVGWQPVAVVPVAVGAMEMVVVVVVNLRLRLPPYSEHRFAPNQHHQHQHHLASTSSAPPTPTPAPTNHPPTDTNSDSASDAPTNSSGCLPGRCDLVRDPTCAHRGSKKEKAAIMSPQPCPLNMPTTTTPHTSQHLHPDPPLPHHSCHSSRPTTTPHTLQFHRPSNASHYQLIQ